MLAHLKMRFTTKKERIFGVGSRHTTNQNYHKKYQIFHNCLTWKTCKTCKKVRNCPDIRIWSHTFCQNYKVAVTQWLTIVTTKGKYRGAGQLKNKGTWGWALIDPSEGTWPWGHQSIQSPEDRATSASYEGSKPWRLKIPELLVCVYIAARPKEDPE